ncbi:MAG: EamA family transporter [Rubrivivax sp.]|nr:EamA family transporter [Rubrivivax sp.]
MAAGGEHARGQGLAMGLAAALIGGGWQVATRQATTGAFEPTDLALIRYGVPALVLLPVLARGGLLPPGVPRLLLALLVLGAGLPFGLLAMTGSRHAPAAHMGVLMAAGSPLIAAALAWALWRQRPSPQRLAGLALMALGVALLAGSSLAGWSPAHARGDLLFLLAALLWAGYTLGFRRSGLGAWQAAALVNAWSLLLVLPALAWQGGSALARAPAADLGWQLLWQGLLAGLLGLWTYSRAIALLGAAQAAAFGALAPVVSALGGWWWLGDRLGGSDLLAIAAAVAGVLLASGAWAERPVPAGARR